MKGDARETPTDPGACRAPLPPPIPWTRAAISTHELPSELPQEPTDAAVIAAVLGGEQEQYALLVRRYQERLFRFALGMVGDSDTAADLVQDSLVKAFTGLHHCNDRDRVSAWLFSIVRNRCLDYLKSPRARSAAPSRILPLLPTPGAGPDEDVLSRETQQAIRDALARLPAAQREAFLLKHLDGCSYEEMAERLGASVSALKMRVLRAREALQALLGDRLA